MYYQYIVNGQDVTDRVSLGANVKERFAEELDVGSITISYSTVEKPEKVLGLVEIKKYTDNGVLVKNWNMYIVDDQVEPITKDNTFFKHELSLIELTHKLDYTIVNALSFTQPVVENVTAPFRHVYNVNKEGLEDPIYEKAVVIEFPDIPKPNSRIYTGSLTIPSVGKANIYEPEDVPDTYNLSLVREEDIKCDVYLIIFDELTNEPFSQELIIDAHNLSQSPLNLENVEDGVYELKIYVRDSFVSDSFEPPAQINYERSFDFGVIMSNRKRYSMYDVIKRIRDSYPLERSDLFENTRLFEIEDDLADKLKKIPAPQLYINRFTTREAINSSLKYVNAVCRLYIDGNRKLTATFFNDTINTFIDSDSNKFVKSDDQSAVDYVSVNRAYFNNTVSSSDIFNPAVKEIGDSYFKGLRSEEYQLLPENGRLKLQYDIFRMVSIRARVNVKLHYSEFKENSILANEINLQSFEKELVIDLTPYFVEESILNLLDPTIDVFGTSQLPPETFENVEFFRDKRVLMGSYKYRSNYIDFGGAVGSFYQRTKLTRIIHTAINEHLTFEYMKRLRTQQGNPVGSFVYRGLRSDGFVGGFNVLDDILSKDGVPLNLSNTDYLEEISFQVDYIPIENTIDDAHKEDTEEINKYTEKIVNNAEPVINYERASVSNYGISQRLGVPTKRYGRIEPSKSTLNVEEVGFVNDKKEVVVEKETNMYDGHEKYFLEVSKDFNRLAKFIAVDRQYRPTEIPTNKETLERNDVYTEYIEYSSGVNNTTPRHNDTFLSNVFLDTFINTIARENNRNKESVKGVIVRTDGFLRRYKDVELAPNFIKYSGLLLPTITMGGKNNLSFEFKFKHNLSAGDSVEVNRSESLSTIADWWSGISTLITGWFGQSEATAENYSPRPYGLWRRFVTYGDDNGEFQKLHFKLLTDFKTSPFPEIEGEKYFDVTRKYPIVEDVNVSNNSFAHLEPYTVAESGNVHTLDKALIVNKDVSEIYSLKYQVTLVPTSDEQNRDLIIGSKLTSGNFLVTPADMKQLRLFLYSNPEDTHGTFEFEIAKEPDAISNLNVNILEHEGQPYGFEITNPSLNSYHHWAIVDDDDNIYLACNKNHRFVFFEPRNKRSTIDYEW